MEQKFESLKKENPEELREYFDFVRASVKDGSYFKDGLNWYLFRYVDPFCQRTIFTLAGIIACIVCYCLINMIEGAFPLIQRDPIIIRAYDESQYFPSLVPLKPHEKGLGSEKYDPTIKTVDEAILKYLLTAYISNREGYDFSKSDIEDVNSKFNRIRNTSSDSEYREFQMFMSKDNPNSPILNFGHNVIKTIEVKSVKFIKREPTDFASKAKEFISIKIPSEAEIRFVANTKTTDESSLISTDRQNYIARIIFDFAGAAKQSKKEKETGQLTKLGFVVKQYKLYKVN